MGHTRPIPIKGYRYLSQYRYSSPGPGTERAILMMRILSKSFGQNKNYKLIDIIFIFSYGMNIFVS